MSDRIDVANVKIDKIFQTQIDDKDRDYLCLWMQDILIPWSILRRASRTLQPLTLADFNRLHKACIENGGLTNPATKGANLGVVLDHEKCAAAVGLTGYKKEYVAIPKDKKGVADCSQIINLLSWQTLVELRHDGHHSLTATGWYKESGKFYIAVNDPWPTTDDTRFDCARAVTQRVFKGAWIDSRPIESFAWFYKEGSDPKWIE